MFASCGSCQAIFTHVLSIKRAAEKIVPKLLNFDQKLRLMDIARDMLTTTFNDDPDLLKKVITGPHWLFSPSKTEDTHEKKAFCYDWLDKSKIDTGAVGDTKKHISEVFQRLEKTLT